MEIKLKACDGINRAKHYRGCNKLSINREHGLCPSCRYDFYTTDEVGKIIYAKSFMPKVRQKTEKRKKENTRQAKAKLISPDQYRAKYVQPIINEICRLIDFGQPCIATGNYGKENAGHYISVGANRTICMNLHNLHIQSFESNHFKSGDTKKYQEGIIKTYGEGYLAFMNSLQAHRSIKLSIVDLETIKKRSSNIKHELKQVQIVRTPQRRIELRNEINKRLGIYDEPFNTFEL